MPSEWSVPLFFLLALLRSFIQSAFPLWGIIKILILLYLVSNNHIHLLFWWLNLLSLVGGCMFLCSLYLRLWTEPLLVMQCPLFIVYTSYVRLEIRCSFSQPWNLLFATSTKKKKKPKWMIYDIYKNNKKFINLFFSTVTLKTKINLANKQNSNFWFYF